MEDEKIQELRFPILVEIDEASLEKAKADAEKFNRELMKYLTVNALPPSETKALTDITSAARTSSRDRQQSEKEWADYVRTQRDRARQDALQYYDQIARQAKQNQMLEEEAASGGKAGGLAGALGNLGTVGQFVFGTVLGITAVSALRKVMDLMAQGIQYAIQYSESLFKLEVAVRGLQRAGLDTTLKEWTDYIKDLKSSFPIFSQKDITDSVSMAQFMTREFGFTTEQIKEVIRLSILYAEINNKDLTESVRGMTFAISSGYTESLQRMGINISKQIIAQKALEMGFKGSYMQLTQNQRAIATLAVVQENATTIQADAGEITKTVAGATRALAASWDDLKQKFSLANPEISLAATILTKLIKVFSDLIYIGQFWQDMWNSSALFQALDAIEKRFRAIKDITRSPFVIAPLTTQRITTGGR